MRCPGSTPLESGKYNNVSISLLSKLEKITATRDFAAIEFLGRKVWMKIDYYDAAMEFGSEDPADASVTTRVMTILLPEDY